ncbi:hypothetical protein JRG66_01290 [Salinimicrobium tongyeongense]|jgi:hypothetical protein|uniref:DUF4249 family protein n=1 Tax=Salinimicrobium tongyeongense TaxID=2809707 RepID=A0ABY6NRM2_9FLAO|nr:hypothetical protein [Salinimicrobium tongyeongense]UZH55559.1 hypothetical protein JRG66_01290 [Salinimicrobium tongyeongense]
MKTTLYKFSLLLLFLVTAASCTTEDPQPVNEDEQKVQLTFKTVLAEIDLQQKDPVVCSDNTPGYVMIGITDALGNYIGENGGSPEMNLIRVELKYNTSLSTWETLYSDELALPAGDYDLQHFIVYDTSDNVLWVAPRLEGTFSEYVDQPLPHEIEVVSGTKPYISIDVLCFYSRNEEAYGYPFFDFDVVEVENSYCVFVNYCDDTTGREYPAYFSMEVWTDSYDGTPYPLSNNTNTITMEGGWPSASVLCIALPDLQDRTFYARVTVLNHDDLDYTADATDTFEFEITQASIEAQEIFIPAYHHVRINCDNNNNPGDPTCDTDVRCRLNLRNELSSNCEFTLLEGADTEGWVQINSDADLQLLADLGFEDLTALGTADVSLSGGEVQIILDTPFDDSDRIAAYAIEVRPSSGGAMSPTCWENYCANIQGENGAIANTFNGFTYTYPFYVRIETINCFSINLLD